MEINRENFTASMKRAVADRGEDYVYKIPAGSYSCMYNHADGPGCIIGWVLNDLGHKVPDKYNHTGASRILKIMGVEDDVLIKAAHAAQFQQDAGRTWGKAFSVFKESVKGVI